MNLEINKNISDFIGEYCSRWNISVAKFAERCNIPYMTVKRIMACDVQKIDVCTVLKIAQLTKAPIMEIVGMTGENLELYKRIFNISSHDRNIITAILNILEKLHISGKECREIPFTDLSYDKKSYLLDVKLFSCDRLDFDQMDKLTFRSSFLEGMVYFGFRVPDNRMNPVYFKGEVLLVLNDDPAEGEIGAYAWKEEGYVRLIFRRIKERGRFTELLPLTGRGRKYIIDNDSMTDLMNWVKIGVVKGVIR